MFLGQYSHSLDDKGRLTVPAKFRELLIGGAFITQGFEENLMVLTPPAFQKISQRVNAMSITDPTARILRRLIFAAADRVDIDSAGRIRIPQFLLEFAGLQNEIMIVGVGDYFELWSPDSWNRQAVELSRTDENAQRFSALDISSGSS